MSEKNLAELREVQFLIEDLMHDYVHAIDNDELEKWPEFFTEKCVYKIISRENYERNLPQTIIYCDSKGMLTDRVTAHRHANIYEPHFYRHIISSIRIRDYDETGYNVQTNYAVFQTKLDGETKVYNTGRYLDKVVVENGKAKFKEKIVVFDTLSIPTLLVTPI